MPRRRLLFVAHAFAPDSLAGVEVYTDRLARGLRAKGWDVAVLCARVRRGAAQNSVTEEDVDGLRVFGLVQNYPYRGLPEAVRDPGVDRAVGRVLDQFAPDVVSVQTLAGLGVGVLHEASRRSIALAVHLHDAWWSCPAGGQRRRADGALCLPVDRSLCGACFAGWRHTEGPLERAGRWLAGRLPGPPDLLHRSFNALPDGAQALARRFNDRSEATPAVAPSGGIEERAEAVAGALGLAGLIVSPSRFQAESLIADRVPLPSWVHVPTGVPIGTRAPRRDRTGPLSVRFLGTWVPHKGPQVFAEALAGLGADDARRVRAEAIGPTPFPAFARRVVESSGGRLTPRPGMPPDQVPALLADTDALVVPSTWAENAPLVVLEARAAGVPVLASDSGGLPELVEDGVDGWRLPPGDVDAWRDRLASMAREPDAVRAMTPRPPTSLGAWVDDLDARYEALE